jgi:hypothetical protein
MSEDSRQKTESSNQPLAVSDRRESPRDGQPPAVGHVQSAISNQQSAITCPFCHGADVELFSLFGSQLLTSEYYCRNCRTVFENVKR